MRADIFLVRQGFAGSRTEAQAAIAAGGVRADGRTVAKPSELLPLHAKIQFRKQHPYVSRGALKLVAALDRFRISPEGTICLDIGASTGGFTEVLLGRGATRVYAVDVGQAQMHPRLAGDSRVRLLERLNARELSRAHISDEVGAIAADVSFISLKLALPGAMALARPGAWMVALVKPQFEVGRKKVGKGGIVRDVASQEEAVVQISEWIARDRNWQVLGAVESPVEGGDGNREFLVAARKP